MKNVSILKRSMIIIYDLLILLALVIILSFPLASISTLDSWIYLFLHQFYIYLIAQIYFVFFWSNGRSTIGMKTWKTIIINDNGTQLSFLTAIYRFNLSLLLNIFFLVGYLSSFFKKDNKALYDSFLKTNLINK
jgi:uncharacterized RDD family membrane protein YckC|tara:strand:- start:1119 stop:1520 length:402 start_codon:yes stop_codon:yes gene_type:complete